MRLLKTKGFLMFLLIVVSSFLIILQLLVIKYRTAILLLLLVKYGTPPMTETPKCDWNDIKYRLDERMRHFKTQCKKSGLDTLGDDALHKPNPWEYVISPALNTLNHTNTNKQYRYLVWCNIFKAASTSWMHNFAILAGFTEREIGLLTGRKYTPLEIVRNVYPRPTLHELHKAFATGISFIIVRHPFERLVSVYKDKIARPLLTEVIDKIIQKYRIPTSKTDAPVTISVPSNTESRLENRRNHFRKECKRLGLNIVGEDALHKPNPWEYIINKDHGLIWCNIFKAASTTWMYNFATLAGYTQRKMDTMTKRSSATQVIRTLYPRPSLDELYEAFATDTSFIIVRHPLERLIAVYKDKILRPSYLKNVAREIITKYRTVEDKLQLPKQKHPTFPEFISYVLDTFRTGENINEHWATVTKFCTPCFFDFQIIAHTETLEEDQSYIIRKANLEDKIKPEWKNKGPGNTAKEINEFYSQITLNQVLELYEHYKYDFALFNYTVDEYLKAAKPDRKS